MNLSCRQKHLLYTVMIMMMTMKIAPKIKTTTKNPKIWTFET